MFCNSLIINFSKVLKLWKSSLFKLCSFVLILRIFCQKYHHLQFPFFQKFQHFETIHQQTLCKFVFHQNTNYIVKRNSANQKFFNSIFKSKPPRVRYFFGRIIKRKMIIKKKTKTFGSKILWQHKSQKFNNIALRN